MIGRAAQQNVSILTPMSKQLNHPELLPVDPPKKLRDIMEEYLKLAIEMDMNSSNAKYTLCQMVPPKQSIMNQELTNGLKRKAGHALEAFNKTKTMEEFS
jgi:tRNA-dihydrouridine synthase